MKIWIPIAAVLIIGIVGAAAYWMLFMNRPGDTPSVAVQGDAGSRGAPPTAPAPAAQPPAESAAAKAQPPETSVSAPAGRSAANLVQEAPVAAPQNPPSVLPAKGASGRPLTAAPAAEPPLRDQVPRPAAPPVVTPTAPAAAATPPAVEPAKQVQAAVDAGRTTAAIDPGRTPKTEPTAPPAATKTPAEDKPAPVPPRGTLQWSGEGIKGQTLTIEGGAASFGTLTGKLPGVPCMIRVQPSDASIAEAPGPGNGFGRLVLRFSKNGRITVIVNWESLR